VQVHRPLKMKMKIELFSRVHHKNIVSLVGFCFEHGEEVPFHSFIFASLISHLRIMKK
jgi:hypothetical protein